MEGQIPLNPVTLSLSKGVYRSWFDKLTTTG